MRPFAWSIILLLLPVIMRAQDFGGNPIHTKWRQLNTNTTRIIYQPGMDSVATSVSTIIQNIAADNYYSLGNKVKKIDILLQNQQVISNGYVSLGPFRSEFYLVPPSDNFDQGSLYWPDQLALHEYRHVQQYNNMDNGISKIMRSLFGQDGYALATNAAVPNWFFEGDAVHQETSLSKQGRGRLPSFLKAYPSLWQGKKNYSWMKLRNGSYKDYVPNHYDLGYLLVNYGYEKYGADFWGKVIHDASAYNGFFYPMQKAMKKYTGISYKQFTNDAFDLYKKIYGSNIQAAKELLQQNQVFPTNYKVLSNYYFPQPMGKDVILYVKATTKQRPAFYIADKKGEHFLFYKDISLDDQFSYKNGKIVYSALQADPRWGAITYSVIKVADIKTGRQYQLKKKTRYFSPDISADGKWIIANKVNQNTTSSLVLLNAVNGAVIKEMRRDGIYYFANPKIINQSKVISAIRNKDATSYIGLIDLQKNEIKPVTPASVKTIGQISVHNNKVYFTVSRGIKDEIFYADLTNGALHQLAIPGLTNYFAGADDEKLTWSSFTADGLQLNQMPLRKARWVTVTKNEFLKEENGIVDKLQHDLVLQSATTNIQSTKYAALTKPINFHSWRPNYVDPEYSFTLYGNNILNTVQTQLYYVYNENERTHSLGGNITYGGLYPFLTLGSQYTYNRQIHVKDKIKQWNQFDNYLIATIPLNWIKGKQYFFFSAGTTLGYRIDRNTGAYKDYFKNAGFSYLSHSINYGQQVQRAAQDIYPRFGYSLGAQYRYAINKYNSWQWLVNSIGYLPGFFPTHSIVLTGAVQRTGTKDLLFGNRIAFARGYGNADSSMIAGASVSYHLPLWYPDWGFANIFYLQRVRGAAFYDHTKLGNNKALNRTIQSTGMEIYFDTKWWNQYGVSFRFRQGYLLQSRMPGQRFFYEFLLPVSLVPR